MRHTQMSFSLCLCVKSNIQKSLINIDSCFLSPSFAQIEGFEGKLEVYLKELSDLTIRVAMLESSADNYIKLDFELLRIELREFEALVSQLKESLNSSSPMFDSLYTEVKQHLF